MPTDRTADARITADGPRADGPRAGGPTADGPAAAGGASPRLWRLLPAGLRRALRPAGRGAALPGHFVFEAAGTTGYCYIRKNACSAVRRMILDTSPHAPRPDEPPIRFLGRCHRLDPAGVAACARMIFIVRDPLERAASGYLQQVVKRLHEPYPVLADSIAAVTGRPRDELSFEDFVTGYLGTRDFGRINVHFLPQVDHLAPLLYTHVLQVATLAGDAAEVFGPAIAGRYFAQPVNDLAPVSVDPVREAWRQPAAALRARFDASGVLPRKADLLAPETAGPLAEIYAADVALLARYRALRAAAPDRVPALDMRGHDLAASVAPDPSAGAR
jgi:hypothetical protein